MFTRSTSIALACAGIFTTISAAQAQPNSEFNPVVVSASRSEQLLSESLLSVSVISKSDIEKTQSGDILNILNSQPGLEVSRTGSLGSATSVYLRGSNSSHALILIDGIPFSGESASGSASSVELIPVNQIEKIEIVRGNASALYGSGAMGGVINLITSKGSGTPKPSFAITYGSKDSKSVVAAYSGEVGDTSFSLSAANQITDGFNAINPASFANVNQAPNGHRNNSLRINLSQKLGGGDFIGVNHLVSDTWTSLDGTSSNKDDDISDRNLASSSFFYNKLINQNWSSKLSYSESKTKSQTYYRQWYLGSPSLSDSSGWDQHKKLSWLNLYELSKNSSMNFGIDTHKLAGYSHVSWNSPDANYKRNINSFFAGYNGIYNQISTQVNIRHDRIKGSDSESTYLVGLGYALNTAWKLTASKSTAFNAPTGGQLADASQGGNSSLKPETSDSYEAGLQYSNSKNIYKVVYFDSRYENLIVPGTTPITPCPFSNCGNALVNAQNASNKGVELSSKSILSFGVVKVSYTHQNPMNDTLGRMLQNRSKDFGAIEYSSSPAILEWGVKVAASSYRYTPDAYSGANTKTSGYAVYSGYVMHKLDKDWSLKGSVENLTDKNYYHVYGYNAAPQMFFLSLRYQPK
jgi:vitamin B12 transporter